VLDVKRLERNRQWLEEQRSRLQSELAAMASAEDEGDRPGYSTHIADYASEVFEKAKTLAVCQQLQKTLAEVNRALDKMSKGVYGTCEACGMEIDPARLKASPHAVLCIKCQTRAELGKGR